MSENFPLPPAVQAQAQELAKKCLAEISGTTAVVIATVDGFDLASAMHVGEPARIAATASSIAAISAVVSEEARLGQPRSVTIDTDSGFAVVHSVTRSDLALVINVVADASAILAQVNYRTAQMAKALAEA